MTDGTLLPAFKYTNITASTVTNVKTFEGILHTVVVNSSAVTATIADGVSGGTSTVIGTVSATAPVTLIYDIQFNNGLVITTTGATATNITVGWI